MGAKKHIREPLRLTNLRPLIKALSPELPLTCRSPLVGAYSRDILLERTGTHYIFHTTSMHCACKVGGFIM